MPTTIRLTRPDTGLTNPVGVAFDADGDLIVSNEGSDSVTEYAPGATGDAPPIATIKGAATGLSRWEALPDVLDEQFPILEPASLPDGGAAHRGPLATLSA